MAVDLQLGRGGEPERDEVRLELLDVGAVVDAGCQAPVHRHRAVEQRNTSPVDLEERLAALDHRTRVGARR